MVTARVPAFDEQSWLALLPTVLHPYVFAGKSWTQVSSALITLAGLTSCCFIVHANLCLNLDCQNFFVSSECSCRVKCTVSLFVNGSNQTTPTQQ